MKKISALLICFNMIFAPLCALSIEDDFVDKTLDKNLKIRKYQYSPITDDFAQSNKNKNQIRKIVPENEIVPEMPERKFIKRPVIIDGDYKEIKVRIKKLYSTNQNLDEGDIIEFETLDEVTINNKSYSKNSTIKARIETISQNKSYGVPSDVIVSNFMLDDNILSGEISKTGANRTIWLRPTVWVLNFFFFAGVPLIAIRGGHAKIKPSETFVLYFQ